MRAHKMREGKGKMKRSAEGLPDHVAQIRRVSEQYGDWWCRMHGEHVRQAVADWRVGDKATERLQIRVRVYDWAEKKMRDVPLLEVLEALPSRLPFATEFGQVPLGPKMHVSVALCHVLMSHTR